MYEMPTIRHDESVVGVIGTQSAKLATMALPRVSSVAPQYPILQRVGKLLHVLAAVITR